MYLSDLDIKKFQELHKQRFGIEISTQEARIKGMRLVRLMKIITSSKSNKKFNK